MSHIDSSVFEGFETTYHVVKIGITCFFRYLSSSIFPPGNNDSRSRYNETRLIINLKFYQQGNYKEIYRR